MMSIRLALALFLLIAGAAGASANRCDQYPFGSQEWWFCMSDKGGGR